MPREDQEAMPALTWNEVSAKLETYETLSPPQCHINYVKTLTSFLESDADPESKKEAARMLTDRLALLDKEQLEHVRQERLSASPVEVDERVVQARDSLSRDFKTKATGIEFGVPTTQEFNTDIGGYYDQFVIKTLDQEVDRKSDTESGSKERLQELVAALENDGSLGELDGDVRERWRDILYGEMS